ncbi:MAG: AAA family ATPase [Bacteroidales bacterium]|nr:AAA family ATPase [Bacteroidales bacterium]
MQERTLILHETLQPNDIKAQRVIAINEEVYTSLVNSLLKEDMAKIAQPSLVVGEPGCGKTFLLKRLYSAIKENIGKSMYPIAIEGKTLYSTCDIWAQCASMLNLKDTGDGYDAILEWQEANSRQLVLLIDNIQYFFKRTSNTEQYELRGKLNRVGAPVLVAFSEKVLPAFTEYNAAFFDGFKISYIKPLTISNIKNNVDGIYDIDRFEKIMTYMPKTVRSMFLAMKILEETSDFTQDLVLLSDYFYSHYQEKFDSINIPTQRILSALSQSDSGLTLSEIRCSTGQENGKISPYLKLMTDQNLINRTAKTSRDGVYSIVDPLFKMWLRHNTTPASKDSRRYCTEQNQS